MAGSCPVVLDVKKSQIKDKCQFEVNPLVAPWQKQTCGFKPHGWKWTTNGAEADCLLLWTLFLGVWNRLIFWNGNKWENVASKLLIGGRCHAETTNEKIFYLPWLSGVANVYTVKVLQEFTLTPVPLFHSQNICFIFFSRFLSFNSIHLHSTAEKNI